jgi:hypothetical protein
LFPVVPEEEEEEEGLEKDEPKAEEGDIDPWCWDGENGVNGLEGNPVGEEAKGEEG